MTQPHQRPYNSIEYCVFAALEIIARLRDPTVHANASTDESGLADRLIATIAMETARIQAGDLGAVDNVLATQALALDTIFTQVLREAVVEDRVDCQPLALALKAQAQSRATLSSLRALKHPSSAARARRATSDLIEQTVENGNSSA